MSADLLNAFGWLVFIAACGLAIPVAICVVPLVARDAWLTLKSLWRHS